MTHTAPRLQQSHRLVSEELLTFCAERLGACPYPAVNQTIAEATIPGGHRRRLMLHPAGGSWTIESPGPVRDVRINENREILAETKTVRRLPARPQR